MVTAQSIAPEAAITTLTCKPTKITTAISSSNSTEQDLVGKIVVNTWNACRRFRRPSWCDRLDPGRKLDTLPKCGPLSRRLSRDNVSGHSTFSRSAAEVLAGITGSPYFPGGLEEREFDTSFLKFESGPSDFVTLQWATYYDAADEAGISRRWGGIHPVLDDHPARILGSKIGKNAYRVATDLFVGVANTDLNFDGSIDAADAGILFGNWGGSGQGDLNFDGIVDAADAGATVRRLDRRFGPCQCSRTNRLGPGHRGSRSGAATGTPQLGRGIPLGYLLLVGATSVVPTSCCHKKTPIRLTRVRRREWEKVGTCCGAVANPSRCDAGDDPTAERQIQPYSGSLWPVRVSLAGSHELAPRLVRGVDIQIGLARIKAGQQGTQCARDRATIVRDEGGIEA